MHTDSTATEYRDNRSPAEEISSAGKDVIMVDETKSGKFSDANSDALVIDATDANDDSVSAPALGSPEAKKIRDEIAVDEAATLEKLKEEQKRKLDAVKKDLSAEGSAHSLIPMQCVV